MNKLCLGSGLISLDILIKDIESNRPISYYVGGTCGNVMMILSHMGWSSYPIARLDDSKQTIRLLADMDKHNVKKDYISTGLGKTPVIIQHNIIDKDGNPTHKFEFKDSNGRFYLSFSPITKRQAQNVLETLSHIPNVFFFDRVSPANIMMAKWMREKGVLVFFEPSCKISTTGFWDCAENSDIIKFSNQRIEDVLSFERFTDKLIIQTCGANGLQYRLRDSTWKRLKSIKTNQVLDTSGAGDWTSATFINRLFERTENFSLAEIDSLSVDRYLKSAQLVASLSCGYDGARGMMALPWKEIVSLCERYVTDM